MGFSALMESIQHAPDNPAHVIVFLTCADSEVVLKDSALKHWKQLKKRSNATFCVSYNLSSHGVTIMG